MTIGSRRLLLEQIVVISFLREVNEPGLLRYRYSWGSD
jgi:hypothetical protein